MRTMPIALASLLALLTASCGGGSDGLGPSGQDIGNALDQTLRSVAGDWSGVGTGAGNTVRLAFRLQEAANGQLSGTGTMQEASGAAAVPFTVSGSYQRPTLTLVFDGLVLASGAVTGNLQGSYTTVGGVATTLTLSGPAGTRQVPVLLQEK